MTEVTVQQTDTNAVNISAPPASTPAAEPKTMPEGGAEKFWNAKDGTYNWEADAREKAWQLSNLKAAKDPAVKQAQSQAGGASQEAINAATTAAGVDVDALNAAILNGEDIPDADRAKLNSVGLSDELIDSVIATQREVAQAHVAQVEGFLGGKAGMAKLADFVTKNFQQAEIEQFNAQLNDPQRWRATASYLLHQAGLPQGRPGTILAGPNAGAPATTVGAYATEAEFMAEFRKPEYRTDPLYRKRVEERLRNSPALLKAGNPRAHTGGL